jgi:hypothetical protein
VTSPLHAGEMVVGNPVALLVSFDVSRFRDCDGQGSDNSLAVSTEILPLHSVQGQGERINTPSSFASEGPLCTSLLLLPQNVRTF